MDILTAHVDTGSWTVSHGDGSGGFLPGVELPAGDSPVAIGTADADGDLDPDVLIVSRNSLEITVHPNPGDGSFATPPSYPMGAWFEHMDAADIDADGDLDVASSWFYSTGGGVMIMRNDGGGAFGGLEYYDGPRGALDVKLRDLNGDALPTSSGRRPPPRRRTTSTPG